MKVKRQELKNQDRKKHATQQLIIKLLNAKMNTTQKQKQTDQIEV